MFKLSKESRFLINYYDKLIKKSNKNLLFPINSKKTPNYINFQKQIFKLLHNIYELLDVDFKNINNYRKIFASNTKNYKILIENTIIRHFINNKYIDNDVIEYIKINPGYLVIYHIPFKDKNIVINVINYSKISQKLITNIDNLIKNMIAQIYLISTLTKNHSCSRNSLTISLFLTPFKREIEKSQEKILGASNTNGGFCYGCISNGEIIIYRQQEVFKVFTHELIHNFGVDKYIWDFMSYVKVENSKQNKLYNKFINNFNLNKDNDVGIQECLVEFWGVFFNNAIYSFIYLKNCNLSEYNEKFKVYKQTFETIMNFEIVHSFLQTTKIIYHNRLTYLSMLSNNKTPIYREQTHIFSYYMLKLFLIFDYKEFVNSQISITNNNLLFFSKSLKNMQTFFDYLILISRNNSVILNFKFMREIYLSLINNNNNNNNNYILINNLRISVLEYFN